MHSDYFQYWSTYVYSMSIFHMGLLWLCEVFLVFLNLYHTDCHVVFILGTLVDNSDNNKERGCPHFWTFFFVQLKSSVSLSNHNQKANWILSSIASQARTKIDGLIFEVYIQVEGFASEFFSFFSCIVGFIIWTLFQQLCDSSEIRHFHT